MKALLFLILLISSPLGAATRFYLPQTGAPAVSPAYDATFVLNGWQDRIAAVKTKISSALTDHSHVLTTGDAPAPILWRQYTTTPIGVQNFNGTTFSGVLRGSVSSVTGSTEVKGVLSVRLYHTDTTFTTLLAQTDADNTYNATARTRIWNAVALANVTSQNNDRLVIDIGISAYVIPANRTVVERFGDSNGTDFALTTGLTTDLDPWIEFSATIPDPAAANSSGFLKLMSAWLRSGARLADIPNL